MAGFVLGVLAPAVCMAQGPDFRVEPLSEPPPAELSAGLRSELTSGVRVFGSDGKPYVDIWLRKEIATSKEPGGAQGALQFPFLAQGDLLGAVRYAGEARDFRDQTLVKGVYTLRYGLQPENGDHLGVSPVRDFGLLLPAEVDTKVDSPTGEALFETSAQASGTEHPAILMMLATKGEGSGPAISHQEAKKWWLLRLPFTLKVAGKPESQSVAIDLVIDGIAEG